MTFVVRAARASDEDALYHMAKSTGGGFTNLPPDRPTLRDKLEKSAAAFARIAEQPGNDLFLFVLEESGSGRIVGTCQLFSKIGATWPFYSYRIDRFAQYSKELDRTVNAEMLVLSTDLDGCSEVGGLFLDQQERASGIGGLLARSRYLFIKAHRARFAERVIAELRGIVDERGNAPFWDGVAGRFFNMAFRDADEFNAIRGNQFIADLMPKHPIYTAMLSESAYTVIGVPHQSGRAARRMLESEGFAFDNYIDIFDGGPTMIARTDRIATIRNARQDRIAAIEEAGESAVTSLAAHGELGAFRACYAQVTPEGDGIVIDPAAAEALGIATGDSVLHVAR